MASLGEKKKSLLGNRSSNDSGKRNKKADPRGAFSFKTTNAKITTRGCSSFQETPGQSVKVANKMGCSHSEQARRHVTKTGELGGEFKITRSVTQTDR